MTTPFDVLADLSDRIGPTISAVEQLIRELGQRDDGTLLAFREMVSGEVPLTGDESYVPGDFAEAVVGAIDGYLERGEDPRSLRIWDLK